MPALRRHDNDARAFTIWTVCGENLGEQKCNTPERMVGNWEVGFWVARDPNISVNRSERAATAPSGQFAPVPYRQFGPTWPALLAAVISIAQEATGVHGKA
jgi:hypothetical protein